MLAWCVLFVLYVLFFFVGVAMPGKKPKQVAFVFTVPFWGVSIACFLLLNSPISVSGETYGGEGLFGLLVYVIWILVSGVCLGVTSGIAVRIATDRFSDTKKWIYGLIPLALLLPGLALIGQMIAEENKESSRDERYAAIIEETQLKNHAIMFGRISSTAPIIDGTSITLPLSPRLKVDYRYLRENRSSSRSYDLTMAGRNITMALSDYLNAIDASDETRRVYSLTILGPIDSRCARGCNPNLNQKKCLEKCDRNKSFEEFCARRPDLKQTVWCSKPTPQNSVRFIFNSKADWENYDQLVSYFAKGLDRQWTEAEINSYRDETGVRGLFLVNDMPSMETMGSAMDARNQPPVITCSNDHRRMAVCKLTFAVAKDINAEIDLGKLRDGEVMRNADIGIKFARETWQGILSASRTLQKDDAIFGNPKD